MYTDILFLLHTSVHVVKDLLLLTSETKCSDSRQLSKCDEHPVSAVAAAKLSHE